MEMADTQCTEARRVVSDSTPDSIDPTLLKLALHGLLIEPAGAIADPILSSAVAHIASCVSCQTWLDGFDPAWAASEKREAHYCCQTLYLAATVEDDPERQFVSIKYARDRDGYPAWAAEGMAPSLRYCPWCAKPLPQEGYEPTEPAA
jgi:hypothetical protein